MWQKAVAGILVLCGTQGFGYAMCQEMKCLLYHDTEQKQMLLNMIGEISYLHRPMQEILERQQERIGSPYREFAASAARSMNEGVCLRTIWSRQLEELQRGNRYPKKALEQLSRIGECLCFEDDGQQLNALKLLVAELEEEIGRIRSRKEERSRLIHTLSLLTGIFCIVLFL